MSIATSDDLAPDLERLEVDQIVEVAVLNDMRLLISPVEIARGGEHNSATFRIIQQPASLDGYVCRAEVETSEGTTYRLVTNGEFSLTSDISIPGIGQLQLVYSDGDAIIRKSYPARFHVTRSINAVDESDPEFQNGLAQLQANAFAQVQSPGDSGIATFFNISGAPVGLLYFPAGSGGGLDEAQANLIYVRQDGSRPMTGDLRMYPPQADDPISIYIGGRQASIGWANALQLRRGAAGEPVQVSDVNGNNASEVVTRALGSQLYLTPDQGDLAYLRKDGGQMFGPLITATGSGVTNPGLGIGDNSTGFFRSGNVLLLSVGGQLYTQYLQAPQSIMFTQPVNMATGIINNLGDPRDGTTGAQDAANRRYVDAAVASVPRPVVPAVRTYIATEVTIPLDGSVVQFFNQPFFVNDNIQRTILVTVFPQFAAGAPSTFYDLEYSTGLTAGLVERIAIYPTQAAFMGTAPISFAATVTPASNQIQVTLSVRQLSSQTTSLVQIGSRATQRTMVVIQEMTG